MVQLKLSHNLFLLAIFLFLFSNFASAQQDSTRSVKKDTTSSAKKSDENKPGEEQKRKDVYIFYAGLNFNKLKVSSANYKSSSEVGWHLGAAYRRGGFFYWQVGARFNSAQYHFKSFNGIDTTHDNFSVSDIDLPITGGINFLAFSNRILNLRLFVSAIPAFELSVKNNDAGIVKDSTNTFNFYGQAGVGVDVFFLVIEAGFNYGFSDLLKNYQSNPGQVFINLGFRF